MNKAKKRVNLANSNSYDNEDLVVLDLLDQLKDRKIEYLEVGSGLCRFPKKIAQLYDGISISCLEINAELAKIAEQEGYVVYNDNFLGNTLASDRYDVVQCSHVIEHFAYPDVIKVIDELLRVTKPGGYLVIRTPLMWKMFYQDIDHIRPYPPESIMNYLNNKQQQVKGTNEVEVVRLWYRTRPKEVKQMDRTSWFYCITPFRKIFNKGVARINKRCEALWNAYRWPASSPNGYVMILKKLS